LDIRSAEVYAGDTSSFFRMVLGAPVPAEIADLQTALEWDFFLDTDLDPLTGWTGDLVANDTGPDCLLRLIIQAGWRSAEIYNINTNTVSTVKFQVAGNYINFSFPTSLVPLDDFDVVVVTRLWRDGNLAAVDKAPDLGHYNINLGYQYVKPGLPDLQFESPHATFWYNEGNEQRVRMCADAYEQAYKDIDARWGIHPSHAAVYVYGTQAELVQGLQTYSGLTEQEAAFYNLSGAPRPLSGVTHIPPRFDRRDIFHQQVLQAMDLFC
jgi:hypothetical protein